MSAAGALEGHPAEHLPTWLVRLDLVLLVLIPVFLGLMFVLGRAFAHGAEMRQDLERTV